MNRIRFSFARKIELAYISHLDQVRLFLRALSRSGLPVAYSQGFNPHPRLILALPLPLGVTAGEEYGEIFFSEEISPEQFLSALKMQMPAAIELTGAVVADLEAPSLASLVGAALYRAALRVDHAGFVDQPALNAALDSLLARDEILMQRKAKKNKITYTNVRPFILEAALETDRAGLFTVNMLLQAGSQGGVSPAFLLEQIEAEMESSVIHAYDWQLHRERLYIVKEDILQPFSEGM
jgi:radical SAM-linked protein